MLVGLFEVFYYNLNTNVFLKVLGISNIFDDINYVENLDMDDIESFVNSIMVFTNAEVTKEGMDAIQEYGAVSIKSYSFGPYFRYRCKI